MTNRPKAIGTAAETAVVRYLAAHGFPAAERRALHGATDLGESEFLVPELLSRTYRIRARGLGFVTP